MRAQKVADALTHLLVLKHSGNECGEFGHLCALYEFAPCFFSWLPYLEVNQQQREFVGEGIAPALHYLAQCRIETQPGLDVDSKEIECTGQRTQQGLLAVGHTPFQ